MDNFYDSEENILALIEEINRITNSSQEYIELAGGYAPLTYIYGKCYYFSRALCSIIPGSEMYEPTMVLHIVTKINNNYYDAEGCCHLLFYNLIKIDAKENYDYLHWSVANEYDDEHLLPVMLKIAKEADQNIRASKENNKTRKKDL